MNESNEVKQKKVFLRRYKKNQAKIKRLEDKIAFIDDRLLNFHSVPISDEPHGTSRISKAELITEKMEYEERIKRLVIKSKEFKREITYAIDSLEDIRYIDVLEAFFIECLTFEEIADKLGYQLRWTIHLYSRAIELIEIEDIHKEHTF